MNLLFVYTDEQAASTLACYGNPHIEMPNLNRLAACSTVFERAYVSQPLCTPSRASLLTGLWPHQHGCTENNVPLQPHIPCLPELLPPGRYITAHIGKWHLGDEIFAQHGFQHWRSIEDHYAAYYGRGRDRNAKSDYHHFLIAAGFTPKNGHHFTRPEAARLPEAFCKAAFVAREACRFIREHRHEPFVLYVNFLEPHMPFFGPRDNQYDPATVRLPANFNCPPTADQPLKTRLFAQAYAEYGHDGQPLRTESDWRRLIARYWGLCSLVDTHLGTILNTVADCGLENQTVIVFTSDHGDMMGSHRLLGKSVMFEEAVRVPLLMRLPGQQHSQRISAPVSQVDLVPTLLDLLGAPQPARLLGQSLRAALEGGHLTQRPVIIEWNGPNTGLGDAPGQVRILDCWRAWATDAEIEAAIRDPVRTIISADGWKYNHSSRGEHELYNLNADPGECHNRANDPDCRPIIRRLRDELSLWRENVADTEGSVGG